MTLSEPIQVTMAVGKVLDDLGVTWLVGGSLASSAHGVPRSTADVDLVAELRPDHVQQLLNQVQPTFYASPTAIEEAISRHSSFNLIHLATMLKVDVFIPGGDELARGQLERRVMLPLAGDEISIPVASPEDIVLQKLRWYVRGGETSQRQWSDVQGVLAVRIASMDMEYLRTQAVRAGLGQLLDRALAEARSGEGKS